MSRTITSYVSIALSSLLILTSSQAEVKASFKEVLNEVQRLKKEFNRTCIVTNISADGSTVAGFKTTFYPETDNTKFTPFLWKQDKFTILPIGEYDRGKVSDISSDGSISVGFVQRLKENSIAVKWVDGKLEKIAGINETKSSVANQVSADGNVVSIDISTSTSAMERRSFVGKNGKYKEISLPSSIDTVAVDMSGDGNTIIGTFVEESPFRRAFHWHDNSFHKVNLDPKWSNADSVSYDGSVIAGTVGGHDKTIYLQKTNQGTLLFRLKEKKKAMWVDLSGDGTMITATIFNQKLFEPQTYNPISSIDLIDNKTGKEIKSYISHTNVNDTVQQENTLTISKIYAFWEHDNWKPTDLVTFMEKSGVNMSDWDLEHVYDISHDGSVLVGIGAYKGKSAAWIIHLPVQNGSQSKSPSIRKIC